MISCRASRRGLRGGASSCCYTCTTLHEKGGKRHDVPAHHRVAAALDEYVEAAGLEARRRRRYSRAWTRRRAG